MVLTGLIATLKYIFSPEVMPPKIPPEKLVLVLMLFLIIDESVLIFLSKSDINVSLCSEPLIKNNILHLCS